MAETSWKNLELFDSADEVQEQSWLTSNTNLLDQLIFCVRFGNPTELERVIAHQKEAPFGKFAESELRHYKNTVIILSSLLREAAISGGVNGLICSRMNESYIQKIEASRSEEEIRRLADDMKRDYCRAVYRQNIIQSNDLIVRKATKYIAEHCTAKMTLAEIASAAGVSREYLADKFKRETGMTVFAYVRYEKVQLAKQLLEYSEASLSDIAGYLGFSSQSHFHRVFKQTEGVTPMEYRRNPE